MSEAHHLVTSRRAACGVWLPMMPAAPVTRIQRASGCDIRDLYSPTRAGFNPRLSVRDDPGRHCARPRSTIRKLMKAGLVVAYSRARSRNDATISALGKYGKNFVRNCSARPVVRHDDARQAERLGYGRPRSRPLRLWDPRIEARCRIVVHGLISARHQRSCQRDALSPMPPEVARKSDARLSRDE